jgi:hypothetical protein
MDVSSNDHQWALRRPVSSTFVLTVGTPTRGISSMNTDSPRTTIPATIREERGPVPLSVSPPPI